MNILIGGDVVPDGKAEELFILGRTKELLGDKLFEIWNKTDCKIFNLECPLTNSKATIKKCGPHLRCSPKCINGIKELSPNCIALANNHIMDYGRKGFEDTVRILDKNKLNWVGVGENTKNLEKISRFSCGKKTISVYNCCEREFSIASQEECGANPFDENYIDKDMRNAKNKSDYLIVVYHGGKEYYRYPSPQLQKRCRRMVECGADLVVCQHSHCIGCEEKYQNGTIVYGQGNFVFSKYCNDFFDTSLLIDIDLSDGFKISYIPIARTEEGTRLANEKESKIILDGYYKRSNQIRDPSFVEKTYHNYANRELGNYMIKISRHRTMLKIIQKFFPKWFSRIKFNYEAILNSIECEAHRELFIEGLKNKISDDKKQKY